MDETSMSEIRETDIAIIGMSGRFPGANNLDTFWQNLNEGKESISTLTDDDLAHENPTLLAQDNYVRAAPILSDVEMFDASFFGYSPKEAQLMDPQQRIFLECAWEAVEDAGYDPERYPGLIGVYGGVGMNTYLINNVHPNVNFSPNRTFLESIDDLQIRFSNEVGYMPTRVSYKLNLKGPSINVQATCSTALVAVHLACQSLLTGECHMALAGGVRIQVPQKKGYLYRDGMILSPDGHCRSFDAQASGIIFGSGAGIVVLKLLSAAIEDRDDIYAVIKGSAVNNDGSMKMGYTAPSIPGQKEVILDAWHVADIDPSTIDYIEAHGTGTELGDSVEMTALIQAFEESSEDRADTALHRKCAVGSVKTNIGHLAEAAGIASLIKTALALKHQSLPASLHYSKPNPKIDFDNSPFYVNTERKEWSSTLGPRRAAVNSFGMGGTNAHIVLEEAPLEEMLHESSSTDDDIAYVTEKPHHLFILSAKSKSALIALVQRYVTYLQAHPTESLADLCFTAAIGRQHFTHRVAVVAQTIAELCSDLNAIAKQGIDGHPLSLAPALDSHSRSIGFLLGGKDSQPASTGRELYDTYPPFREAFADCDALLQPHLGISIIDVLFEPNRFATGTLNQPQYTQPILFAFEYALAELWKSWGVVPSMVMGHGVGEYVAASLAGLFSLEDALRMVAERSRLIQTTTSGAMATAIADEITVKYASHSLSMEPIRQALERVARSVVYAPPQLKLISSLTGKVNDDEMMTPEYWSHYIRQPTLFAAGMASMVEQGVEVLIELSPAPTLLEMDKLDISQYKGLWFPAISPRQDLSSQLINSLAELYMAGFSIEWETLYEKGRYRRLHLPTYPFQRESYWIDSPFNLHHPLLPKETNSEAWNVKQSDAQDILQQLQAAPIHDRRSVLVEYIQNSVSHVLGIKDAKELTLHQGFIDYGMSSVTSIQLRDVLQSGLDCSLSQTIAFTYPTTDALVNHLIEEILPFAFIEPVAEAQDEENAQVAEVQQLSDEDVEALLLQELEDLELRNPN